MLAQEIEKLVRVVLAEIGVVLAVTSGFILAVTSGFILAVTSDIGPCRRGCARRATRDIPPLIRRNVMCVCARVYGR